MTAVGGSLLVDKPAGPTSHDVVARVRALFHTRAVGHTGTLDPFATGLLILVLGGATRLARWAEQRPKTYWASARLGRTTSTDDSSGEILTDRPPAEWPAPARVSEALAALTGPQHQRPPSYSAKLVGGVRSYRLARKQKDPVELPAVPVIIHRLELLEYRPPSIVFRAEVSPGTYVRALGRDLGEALGTGAHLTALRRERIGDWSVDQATPLEALTGTEELLPPEALLGQLPRIALTPEEARSARHGRDLMRADGGGSQDREAALFSGDRLVGVARRVPGGWHPAVVLPESADLVR